MKTLTLFALSAAVFGAGFVSAEDLSRSTASAPFAFALFQRLRAETKPGDNLFFSPTSVFAALAMTLEGARGETAVATRKVMAVPETFRPETAGMALLAIADNADSGKTSDCQLRVANAFWVQKNFKILKSYTDALKRGFAVTPENLDFIDDPRGAANAINAWVAARTAEKIRDIVNPALFNSMTRSALVNAIYFKAAWRHPFSALNTAPAEFRLANGQTKPIDLMNDKPRLPYAEGDDFQAVELPYKGERGFSMIIVLPKKERDLENFLNGFTPERYRAIEKALTERIVNIYLPRFRCETFYPLRPALTALGMGIAFSDNADFSGVTGNRELQLDAVLHKTFIDVKEEGTEAAAATVVISRAMAMPPFVRFVTFRADHPFLYVVRQRDTGEILFMGLCANPPKTKIAHKKH